MVESKTANANGAGSRFLPGFVKEARKIFPLSLSLRVLFLFFFIFKFFFLPLSPTSARDALSLVNLSQVEV